MVKLGQERGIGDRHDLMYKVRHEARGGKEVRDRLTINVTGGCGVEAFDNGFIVEGLLPGWRPLGGGALERIW